MASRAEREPLQGDLVTEAFELPDQALGVPLGVVAEQEVVGTELGVGAAALEHVVGDGEDGMRATAPMAFLWPRRPLIRAYWLAR